MINYINRMKDKNNIIILIDAEKTFEKISIFSQENSQQMGYRRNISQHRKAIYDKITANITLNGERLKAFLTTLRIRQWCPYQPLSFTIELKVLARCIRQEEEINVSSWKARSKFV